MEYADWGVYIGVHAWCYTHRRAILYLQDAGACYTQMITLTLSRTGGGQIDPHFFLTFITA